MDYVLGCDIGSQGVKVVLVSAEGRLAGEAGAPYAIEYPYPTWAEQPAGRWIEALKQSIARLIHETGVSPAQIKALGLDAQVDGLVPVDVAGKPVRSAIIWMDRRAVSQVETVQRACSPQQVFRISGLNLDPYHVAPKIMWFKENQPELYEKSRYFLLPGSYVAYYLTGEMGVDYSNASSMLLLDVASKEWSDELCEVFQIPKDRLPPVYPANRILGTLTGTAAGELGLLPETRVTVGCGDEHAACLGAGVIVPGLVCDIAGTAEPVAAASARLYFDETGLVETHCHADPDLWLLENPGFVSGANYRWFRDQFGGSEVSAALERNVNPYELLNSLAEKVPPGSDGLIMLPCLMGAVTPTWNSAARGTFLGFTLTHTREHYVRAVLEASAYALRDITDQMQHMGLELREIRAVGGGARSPLWRQIKADVTGLPVVKMETVETTALGAALLALDGAGMVGSLAQAVQAAVKTVETREPNPVSQARYQDYYQVYRKAYFALLPVFEFAAHIHKV